jgi:signal transduction histidine kinase
MADAVQPAPDRSDPLGGGFEALARALAHELRNPLNAMRLNLELLREDLHDLDAGEETLEIAASLSREIDQLAQITTAFRDYTRRLSPRVEEVELGELCLDLVTFLRPQLEAAGVSLTHRLTPVTVRGDRTILRQAVLNLLLNAIEAVERGGGIEATCEATDDGGARITIADDGPGFSGDPEEHFRLFSSTKDEGTGIGLPLARKIARVHGGEVNLRNRPGGGAEVIIELAAAPPADR